MGVSLKKIDPLPPDYVLLTSREPALATGCLTVSRDSISDYRCPLSDYIFCVWQGDAELFLTITKA